MKQVFGATFVGPQRPSRTRDIFGATSPWPGRIAPASRGRHVRIHMSFTLSPVSPALLKLVWKRPVAWGPSRGQFRVAVRGGVRLICPSFENRFLECERHPLGAPEGLRRVAVRGGR